MATKAPHQTDALDAQLVLRAQDGDRDAFLELFRRHAKPAWRLALAVGGSAEIAADAVAKGYTLTLVRLHRRTTTLTVPFRHLVTRTSGEAAASASRRDDSPADPAPNDLAEAFLALPERWRAALWLTLVEGGTPAQIAPIVGLSEEGTASLVDRACAGLRSRFARSTPLGASLLGDCRDAKPKLRALAVPMPAALEARAVTQWQAWQRTLVTEKRRGFATLVPLPAWADRAVSAAAVAVFAAGIALALNQEAATTSREPMVALPVTRNSAPGSVTFTPAAFVAGPATAAASPTHSTSRGGSVYGASKDSPATTPTTIADAAVAGADAGTGTGTDSSTTTSIPPADTQGASTPNAGASTSVAGTPVAITAGTDGVGATVGDTTIGSTTTTTAPSSGTVTVILNPGGGLDPIGVTLP